MLSRTCAPALVALALLAPMRASAADILFVSDISSDTGIASALSADGHTVTMVVNDYSTGNARLQASLAAFDAVYWSATGGAHSNPAIFSNLNAFVMGGGRVLVTGYDSLVGFPEDPMLIAFLGGTGSRDTFTAPGPLSSADTSLTVGVVDIRGVTPSGSSDNDCLNGFGSDTQVISANGADATCAQWTLRSLGAGEIAYVSSGSSTVWTTTTAGGPGAYNAAIRNYAASGGSGVSEPGAPDISFEVPGGTDEGSEITVRAVIEDFEGDTFDFSWDLDDDGTFGELPGEFTHVVPAGTTDGPEGLRVGIEAIDGRGNRATRYRTLRVVNVAPRVTSEPPRVVSIGVDMRYQIVTTDPAGDLDPPSFTLTAGPGRMSVGADGLVSWVPNESDVTAVGDSYRVEVTVDDGDGGETVHGFDLEVSPNRAPSAPQPTYPIDMIAIIDRRPRLATQNAEDFDLDPLGYIFQIDTVDTFDSEALRESPIIPETDGFTAWRLDEPLDENRLYHWRVRADDGIVYSEWRGNAFYVVRDPSLPPPDAGQPDGGVSNIPDAALIPGLDAGTRGRSGTCSVGSAPASSAPVGGLALAGLALLGVRRRRAG